MSKFKAGDLALIVNAKCSENIGRVVELIRLVNSDVTVYKGVKFTAYRGGPAWEVNGELVSVLCDRIQFGFLSESCLIPLRGDFQPEEQHHKELQA